MIIEEVLCLNEKNLAGSITVRKLISQYPAIPFIAPFATFIVLLALRSNYPLRVIIVTGVLLLVAPRISWRPVQPLASVAFGILVFVIWVGPDVLWPSYRDHWLFQNNWMGMVKSSLDPGLQSDVTFLIFRCLGTALLVPVIEELFWRGWLMRYIIKPGFTTVPLGTYSALAFWVTALLFASEHGPFWDVGLLAGMIYNGWMIRTKSLADCMLAHGVTNACLAGYVLTQDQWQYWL